MVNPEEITEKIKIVLEKMRPAIQQDGGDFSFVDYNKDDNIVYITFCGACTHCVFSTYTLKMGLEQALRQEVDDGLQVIDTTAR